MDEGTDGYRKVALHGLWPIVADPDAATGVRFADLSRDPPEACIGDASALPGIDLALRTFPSEGQRTAWLAGASEFGGNAFAAVPGPALAGSQLRFALVAHLDRSVSRTGGPIEGAIPLLRDLEGAGPEARDLAAEGDRGRALAITEQAAARRIADWRSLWAAEIEALSGVHEVRPDGKPPEGGTALPFRGGWLVRHADGLRAIGRIVDVPVLDEDLRGRLSAAAAERGWRVRADGHVERDMPALDAAGAKRLADELEAIRVHAERVATLQGARTTLIALHIDPESIRVLKRMHEGFPLATQRFHDPGAQISPRTGKPGTVAASRVERLLRAGLIVPRWWLLESGRPEQSTNRRGTTIPVPALSHMYCILWGLTRTARTMIAGGVEGVQAASETQPEDAGTGEMWLRGALRQGAPLPEPHKGLEAAVAELPKPAEAAVPVIAEAVRIERLPEFFPNGSGRLALLGAAMAAGLLVSDGKRVRPADAGESGAAPPAP